MKAALLPISRLSKCEQLHCVASIYLSKVPAMYYNISRKYKRIGIIIYYTHFFLSSFFLFFPFLFLNLFLCIHKISLACNECAIISQHWSKESFEMQGMIRIYLRINLFLSHKKCTEWVLYLKNHLWMCCWWWWTYHVIYTRQLQFLR